MARSVVSRDATGTLANVSPVNLSMTGIDSFSDTHFPATYSLKFRTVAFMGELSFSRG
jgi:hypothetical protein